MKRLIFLIFTLSFIKNIEAQEDKYIPSDTTYEKHIMFIFQEMTDMKKDMSDEAKEKRNRDAEELYAYYQSHSNETTGQLALGAAYSSWWGNKDYEFIRNKFENEDLEREEFWTQPFNFYRRAFWNRGENNLLVAQLKTLAEQVSNPKCLAVIYENIGEWSYLIPDLESTKKWFLKLVHMTPPPAEKHLRKAKTYLYEIDSLQIGMPAPDFTATDLKGQQIKLSDLKGKVIFLDFWATWCGFCVAELPEIKAMNEKYKSRNGFQVIGISLDKELDKWESYINENNLDWINICDGKKREGEIVRLYNAMGIPKYYIIDQTGKIRYNESSEKAGIKYQKIVEELLMKNNK
ncbi:MAG: TlpA disulfide reductase family protein [Bacteroidota bacterium]